MRAESPAAPRPGTLRSWSRGLATLAPAREMIGGGLRALLACLDPTHLDPSSVAREFDGRPLSELQNPVHPCGENGELHTVVSNLQSDA